MSCSKTLREKGYKLTPQRRMILDILHQADSHLCAEDILAQIQSKVAGVNKSTVYRTLELLEKLGLVVKCELEGRMAYHHAEEGHHHHLVCRQCGRVVDCDESILKPLEDELVQELDFRPDLKHLVVYGLCSQCTNGN